MSGMRTQSIMLDHPDGEMRLYEAVPDEGATAGIVVIQEAFGVNGYIEDVTRRLADAGYHAVAPDLFHRAGGGTAPYDDFSKVLPLFEGLDGDDKLLADIDAALGHLNASGLTNDHVGIIGFCFGGRISLLACLRRDMAAGVGMYGGGIVTQRFTQFPTLLDELTADVKPWLGLFGDLDQSIPVDDVETLRAKLEAVGATADIHRYANAGHGFHCNVRDAYVEDAAEDAWARALQWFDKYVPR
jgi:carboxymethylenebutenolidase